MDSARGATGERPRNLDDTAIVDKRKYFWDNITVQACQNSLQAELAKRRTCETKRSEAGADVEVGPFIRRSAVPI